MSKMRNEWLSVKGEAECVMIMFLYSEDFECELSVIKEERCEGERNETFNKIGAAR